MNNVDGTFTEQLSKCVDETSLFSMGSDAADYNNDYLYDFDLIEDRTRLDLNGNLADKVANNNQELDDIVFGQGFGISTDIREGPDGYLYVLSHLYGNLYRIVPNSD
jgi:hypothetical protein